MEKELIVEELDNTKHMFHNFVPAHSSTPAAHVPALARRG
jgi:hypothetical protein